jgi:hypothetical protein
MAGESFRFSDGLLDELPDAFARPHLLGFAHRLLPALRRSKRARTVYSSSTSTAYDTSAGRRGQNKHQERLAGGEESEKGPRSRTVQLARWGTNR